MIFVEDLIALGLVICVAYVGFRLITTFLKGTNKVATKIEDKLDL